MISKMRSDCSFNSPYCCWKWQFTVQIDRCRHIFNVFYQCVVMFEVLVLVAGATITEGGSSAIATSEDEAEGGISCECLEQQHRGITFPMVKIVSILVVETWTLVSFVSMHEEVMSRSKTGDLDGQLYNHWVLVQILIFCCFLDRKCHKLSLENVQGAP